MYIYMYILTCMSMSMSIHICAYLQPQIQMVERDCCHTRGSVWLVFGSGPAAQRYSILSCYCSL